MSAPAGLRLDALADEHVAAAAGVYREAFAGAASVALGPLYASSVVCWFARQPVRLSHVACVDRQVAGLVLGAPQAELPGLYRRLLPVAALALARHPWLLLRADIRRMSARRLRVIAPGQAPPGTQREALLHTLAVAPRREGQGVGGALLEAFVVAAGAAGSERARLQVLADNERARRLYEVHGWTPGPGSAPGWLTYARDVPAIGAGTSQSSRG